MSSDHTGRRHLHVADHAQAIHFGPQTAQFVRQRLRQHRNHAAREIHAGRAFAGISVERSFEFHVMRNVGDGDDQTIALAGLLGVYRVIEIFSGFAVDRH